MRRLNRRMAHTTAQECCRWDGEWRREPFSVFQTSVQDIVATMNLDAALDATCRSPRLSRIQRGVARSRVCVT